MNGINATKLGELRELLGDDFPFLVQHYLEDTAVLIQQLQAHIGQHLDDDVRKAHSIKSTSLNMGADAVAEVARKVEQRLKSGGVLVNEDWVHLSRQFETTADHLRGLLA